MAMCWGARGNEPAKYKRALPPAHFLLKIESFSALSKSERYDSRVFKAGGFNWSLSLHPKGNESDNGSGYISLYLSLEEPIPNLKVHVNYRLFVKSRDEYLTIQEADDVVRSFHRSKTQWGFPRFLSLKKFENPSNGYLENDSCTFGAEVFVIQPAVRGEESFALTKYPPQNTFTWKIERWSTLGTRRHFKEFRIVGRQWKLLVDPNGDTDRKEKSLSVDLEVQGLNPKEKVYAEFDLRVLDQLKNKHQDKKFECWLCASHPRGGDAAFMPLKDLEKKSKKGFVCDDTLIVEVQFRAISVEPKVKLIGV